ncbi:Nickel-dependent lactate racemase [Raineyella antarctica]|uniref:Nickel-dependent lactate racemase n=1 Tax=Raineyella antarctica TaxID=1577474 RepID=A0A1G6GY58_9ACTN|nr:lactate racemase domain-containing protein [Raineyella antarctica]SDB86036.1 Nickel-dependent lactate racemase [Raineyella antarctica]
MIATNPPVDHAYGTYAGDASKASFVGGPDQILSTEQVEAFVTEAINGLDVDGKNVCLIVPDATRTCPLPLLLGPVHKALQGRVASMKAVIALGTHQAMSEESIAAFFGYEAGHSEDVYPGLEILNHEFWKADQITDLGTVPAERVTELSGDRLHGVPMKVELNRHAAEADIDIVIGPIFPHEVVGISGGNKYFFPGLSVHSVIDVSHWVGALIGTHAMIGTRPVSPVRALINEACRLIPADRYALCFVVKSNSEVLQAVSFGVSEDAWAACADVAVQTHVVYKEQAYDKVISVMPKKYEDIWTAAKGFYKLEPIVADGGLLVIYAPHITEISVMHKGLLDIGYHTIDYFVKQWDKFKDHPWGELAHSTHLRGPGSYDAETGVETDRVRVALATGIPREVVESVALEYIDPATMDLDELAKEPGTFVEPHAGEVLYRLESERPKG